MDNLIPTRKSLLVTTGFLALWIEIAYPFGAMSAGLAEPFPSVERYFAEIFSAALPATAAFLFLSAILAGIALVLSACGTARMVESLAKVSLAMLLPVVLWATLFALDATNDHNFGLHIPAPAWVASPWVKVFGSSWGFVILPPLGLTAWVTMMFRETRKAKNLIAEGAPG